MGTTKPPSSRVSGTMIWLWVPMATAAVTSHMATPMISTHAQRGEP